MSFAKSATKNPVYRNMLMCRGDVLEIHTFTLEPEGKNRYSALVSMQWFQERELELRYGDKPKKNLPPFYVGLFEQKHFVDKLEKLRREDYAKRGEEYEDIWTQFPHFHHESLWDFYKAVGYDYKAKKWTRPLPN
jgi:hypothetical protein